VLNVAGAALRVSIDADETSGALLDDLLWHGVEWALADGVLLVRGSAGPLAQTLDEWDSLRRETLRVRSRTAPKLSVPWVGR